MAQLKSLDHFFSLLDQYKQAAFPNQIKQETSPGAIFELFETVDHVKSIPDQQVIEVLIAGCKSLDYEHSLSRPFCQFLYKQLSKQIRVTNFRSSQFDVCIKYILDGIDTLTNNHEHKVDLLRALSALVFENASNSQRFASRLSTTLLALANRTSKPLEVRRMAINCIGNVCAGNSAGTKLQPLFQDFYACLLGNVCTVDRTSAGTVMVASSSHDFTDTAVRKVASSTLRSLQFLLAQDKSLVTNPLCDIIEIIYTFIFMNVSVQSYSMGNPVVLPSVTISSTRRNRLLQPTATPTSTTINSTNSTANHGASVSPRPLLQFSWRTPLQQRMTSSLVTSSESELSDSTSLTEYSPRRQRDNAKIRINALLCLSAIANTSSKALYPHWHKFLPDTFSIFLSNNLTNGELPPLLRSDNQPYSLFTVLLYDPMVTVRTAVCSTLLSILDGSKQYLNLAIESDKSTSSFTSLSENLGSIIRDIHRGLIYALGKEKSNQVLIMMMNVTTLLVENCSYERLSKHHLPSLYHAVTAHWKEQTLRSSILKVILAIFSIHQESLEDLIQTNLIDRILLEAIKDKDEDVQLEAWRTCTTLTKTYFAQTMPILWQKLTQDGQLPIHAASLKWIEAYASATMDEPETDQWWQVVLENNLQKACSHELAAVRAAACDCFASMSKSVFENFHYRHQRLAVTLLFSLVSDTDANVRAAACRALGVFILFPSLREDPMFVSSMTKAILLQKEDKTILVRVRVSWAIGNLCDALVLESEKPEFNLREYMSTTEWIDVLSTATAGSLDNDKLRSNAVRAIGSLLRVTPKAYYENTRIMSLVKNAVHGLVKNIESGSLKTRWNACHATSNMLLNPHFPIGYIKQEGGIYPWTQTLFQSLIKALLQCKNFKVRINACLAITTPREVDQYGDKLPLIVKSILEAWDICQQNQEYKEIKYKQQLEQQITDSLNQLKPWIPLQLKDSVQHIIELP